MQKVYIIAAKRTPIGTFGGSFEKVSAVDLGTAVVNNLLEKAGIAPYEVNEVIFGNVLSAGLGQNVSRQVALKSGIPEYVPSYSINKVCGSGMKSIHNAYQTIALGEADVIIAGGTENMNQAPYLIKAARSGLKFGHQELTDSMLIDGLWCTFNDYHMGITAENLAEKYNISRQEQDEFAYNSQQKAAKATKESLFCKEIVSMPVKKGKLIEDCSQDEHIRPETTIEKLSQLKPAFKKDGTVTAGNASGINDGAAALILASEKFVQEKGLKPIAEVTGFASAGVDPSVMGIGPVAAVNRLVEKTDINLNDVDLFEFNEAFAVQSLAVLKELKVDPEKVNIYGGAIALGHPIGASGARIVATLLNAMTNNSARQGIASLCIGGGQGIAMSLKAE